MSDLILIKCWIIVEENVRNKLLSIFGEDLSTLLVEKMFQWDLQCLLFADSGKYHTASVMNKTFPFRAHEHLSYSPNFAPLDYYLYGSPQRIISKKKFSLIEKLKEIFAIVFVHV